MNDVAKHASTATTKGTVHTARGVLFGLFLLLGALALSPALAEPNDNRGADDSGNGNEDGSENGSNDNEAERVEGPLEYAERVPSPGTDEAPPEPGEPSRLTVRLAVDAELAREHLESVTRARRRRPQRYTQNGPDGADGGLFADLNNYDYRYWYERGPFDVRASKRGLHVRSRIEANLDARTRLLPQTPRIERRLRNRRVDIGADLSVGVDEEWNLKVEVEEFHLEVLDPITIEIAIPGADPVELADVTSYVEEELRALLEERLPGLIRHVEDSVNLPAAVGRTWHEILGTPHRFELPGEPEGAEFLLRPSEAALGDVHGDNGRLLIDIEVVCRPLLSLAELDYESPELPPNGELESAGAPFHVLAEVLLPLARLSEQLDSTIVADSDDEERAARWRMEERNIWVQIRHANVTADGDELMVMLLVDSNLHPERPARIGLLTRPELSEDGTTLTFEDLRMTETTAQWWRTRYRLLPAEPLLERVAESLVFDFEPELSRVRDQVGEFLTRTHPLNENHQLRGEGGLDEPVRLRDIRVKEAAGEAESFDEDDARRHLAGNVGASAVLYVEFAGRMLAHIEPRSE